MAKPKQLSAMYAATKDSLLRHLLLIDLLQPLHTDPHLLFLQPGEAETQIHEHFWDSNHVIAEGGQQKSGVFLIELITNSCKSLWVCQE